MIVVTGASGFIGSCLVSALIDEGHKDLLLVDEFMREDKRPNLEGKDFAIKIDRDIFLSYFESNHKTIDFVYHLGARTDTAEKDEALFDRMNLNYSRKIWEICTRYNIPLIYASSAATYGDGNLGYDDDHEKASALQPLNPYGWSKQRFDLDVLDARATPPFWAGIKFFNVYGPNEYHKGRMASVIFHAYNQIRETGKMKLFRSHRDDIADGHQKRDFVYIKDVLRVLLFLKNDKVPSGLYNLGTGKARTFLDLVKAVFDAMGEKESIEFIDTPEDIRDTYQYFTEANMSKLRSAGYKKPFHSLEEGVKEYVQEYLEKRVYY